MVVVPRENDQSASMHGYPTSHRPLTDSPQPNLHLYSAPVRPPPPLRDRSRVPTRVRRRSSRNASSGSESFCASLTADSYNPVHQESRAYDDTRAPTKVNAQKREGGSLDDVSLARENKSVFFLETRSGVAQHTKTSSHHDVIDHHGVDSKVAPPLAEESQSRSADEEDNSSDGSDASFFNCGQCGKSFAQRSVLQIHVCPNMPRKPYHCGHCSQSFDYPNELRMHAVIHAGEKPFKCGYCSRSFAGATTLHNHVRTHTGEKPFSCERCGKTFTQASQLHKHEVIPGDCVPCDSLHN